MVRNAKAIEPIRVSKRIAEAKSMIKPIQGMKRKKKLVPQMAAHESPITKRRKKKVIKATNKVSENERGKGPFASEVAETDISFKTLYIETQKKVEDLTEKNYKQAIDLSYRSGQVDAYEYVIGNMKNAVGFSNMMRVADADINLSKETAPDAPSLNQNHL
ncbi:unnamed protein product [Withania somnifera]